MNGGGAEREGDTESAPGSEPSAQILTRGSNSRTARPWPGWSRTLNRLHHPGTPRFLKFLMHLSQWSSNFSSVDHLAEIKTLWTGRPYVPFCLGQSWFICVVLTLARVPLSLSNMLYLNQISSLYQQTHSSMHKCMCTHTHTHTHTHTGMYISFFIPYQLTFHCVRLLWKSFSLSLQMKKKCGE